MDNPEEIVYQAVEDLYLEKESKYNVGDVVYFNYTKDDVNKQSIGIIKNKRLVKNRVSYGTAKDIYMYIAYDIVHPKGIAENISECVITSASKFIFRQYLDNNAR